LALVVLAFTQVATAQDVVILKSSTERKGKISGVEEEFLKLSLPAVEEALGSITISIPLDDIASMQCKSVKLPEASDSDTFISAQWRQWLPLLTVEGSPASRIGVEHTRRLLKQGKTDEALALFRKIEAEAWDAEGKLLAKSARLDAMIENGQIAEAQNEAKEFAKTSDDPATLIKSRYILATTASKALQKLVEDNPRFSEDPVVAREHTRLYNEALDNFLYAPVFYGAFEEDSARSLAGAIALYRFCGEDARALECARDIVKFHPTSPQAIEAAEFIKTLPEDLRAYDPEKIARGEDDDD